MSISMEQYVCDKPMARLNAAGVSAIPVFPYHLQCRACGFEPEDAVTRPPRCPKCGGGSWERFPVSRSLLMNAERRDNNDYLKNAIWPTPLPIREGNNGKPMMPGDFIRV